jgi:hypothetical protein
MRKLILSPLFIIALVFPSIVYAQTIQTGDEKAETKVENNVSGGTVYTKIEVEANGEKKILETTEQGVHKLEVNSNNQTSVANKEVSSSATITPKKELRNIKKNKESISEIFKNFRSWISNLFKNFKFF